MSKEKHQMTNHLLTLGLQIGHIRKTFPIFMEGYLKAKENNLLTTSLSDKQFILVKETVEAMDEEFQKLKELIDNLPIE